MTTDEQFATHMVEDKQFQEEQRVINISAATFQAETEGSLASLHETLKTIPDAKQTAEIVEEVIKKLFYSKGKTIGATIVATGGIFFALGSIWEGLKAILSIIGFSIMHK